MAKKEHKMSRTDLDNVWSENGLSIWIRIIEKAKHFVLPANEKICFAWKDTSKNQVKKNTRLFVWFYICLHTIFSSFYLCL